MKHFTFNSFTDAFTVALILTQKGIKCKGIGISTLAVEKTVPNSVLNEVFTTYPPKS